MLGLGASSNNEQGCAIGERFRQIFNKTLATYNISSVPIGSDIGIDYIGDFTQDSDFEDFDDSNNVTLSRHAGSSSLNIVADATNGYAFIGFHTTIGVKYTISLDLAGVAAGNAAIWKVGESGGDHTHHNSGYISVSNTYTDTFIATTSSTVLSLYSKANTKYARFSNISVKKAS